jgi:hypothetical protein
MQLTDRNSIHNGDSLMGLKGFLIWNFTLLVCLLVVGFPLVVIMMTVGALLAMILQSVLPMSSVLIVAGTIIGVNVLAIIVSSAVLTLKGIHPQKVSWLKWLHGEENHAPISVYASCPLTCGINH